MRNRIALLAGVLLLILSVVRPSVTIAQGSPASFLAGAGAVSTQIVNSGSATGTSAVLALDGQYSNCTVFAQASSGAPTITVWGNGQQAQYGPSAPAVQNPNFGTSGAITVGTSLSATSGNVANLPVGFYFTWSGNTGTLTAWATCTSAIARATGGSGGPTPSPVPPAAFGVLYASTGKTSVTSGASGAYVTVPCAASGSTNCSGGTLSFTTGTSIAPNGLWLITVTLFMSTSTVFTTNQADTCATSPTTMTILDATTDGSGGICSGTLPTNAFMGGPGWGGNQNANGFAQTLIGHITVANSTLFSMQCALTAAAAAVAANGYCAAEARMY